jgi:hypothetical protein
MHTGAELHGVIVVLLRETQRHYVKLDESVQMLRDRMLLQQPLLVSDLEAIATHQER